MTNRVFNYAFRILGSLDGPRKRVDAAVAMAAYRSCDARAKVDCESYLSHYRFDDSFRDHLSRTGSPRGFEGPTWAPEIIFDIDREGDLPAALEATRKLVTTLEDDFGVPPEAIVRFFSGNKGFHVALPGHLFHPQGGPNFHRIAAVFATLVAAKAGVIIDTGIYDRVRALRAPNSRHPKTGLHKRHIPFEDFRVITPEQVLTLAREPSPFEVVDSSLLLPIVRLVEKWRLATNVVVTEKTAANERAAKVAAGLTKPVLNRLTMDIIRGESPAVGDRHRLIYSAARDLAETGAPRHLIDALLREPALDTGLPPKEVERQLDCGYRDGTNPRTSEEGEKNAGELLAPGPNSTVEENAP